MYSAPKNEKFRVATTTPTVAATNAAWRPVNRPSPKPVANRNPA